MEITTSLIRWEEEKIVTTQQKLANFVQQYQAMIAINQNGIPNAYVDPTVIAECVPYSETLDDIPEDKYKSALIRIEYEDGMPVANGLPVWERLDGEKIDYYKIFKEYRDMKYSLVKAESQLKTSNGEQVSNAVLSATDTMYLVTTRSMAKLSEQLNVPGKLINILSKIYHWAMRVKAFDIQRQREIALKKQQMVEVLESKHARVANELLDEAVTYLKTHPNQLNPNTALQMVELGMKYSRISSGLLGDKPGSQAAAVHQTNIAISQSNTHNEADNMINVDNGMNVGSDTQGDGQSQSQSAVERQLSSKMKDTDTLMSVLHVLNKSGALKAAVKPGGVKDPSNEGDDLEESQANIAALENEIKSPILVEAEVVSDGNNSK